MHRTTGNAYATIGSLVNQHIDQSLPGTPGTIIAAELLNAVQEEIINVIEQAGISIESGAGAPATDRSNGFEQLKTAIFESQAIDTDALAAGAVTDTKVTSVSLTKLVDGTATIAKTVLGDDYAFSLSPNSFSVTREDSGSYPVERFVLNVTGLEVRYEPSSGLYVTTSIDATEWSIVNASNATYDAYSMIINVEGAQIYKQRTDGARDYYMRYGVDYGLYNSNQTSTRTESVSVRWDGIDFYGSEHRIKCVSIDVSGGTWSSVASVYQLAVSDIGIEPGSTILGAKLALGKTVGSDFVTVIDGSNYGSAVLQYYFSDDGTQTDVIIYTEFDGSALSYSSEFLTVWYSEDGR